jgi:ABC-type lipoprotein release transport system permease subunit
METLPQDLRYGFRRLWKSPGFTAVAVVAVLTPGGLTARLLPARRATQVDPMVALSYE